MSLKFMEESSHEGPLDKKTSRCWDIRLTTAPHWAEILLEQGVKTNTWTQKQDTWHFKAILAYGPSSLETHGVSLTPIMKPKSSRLPGQLLPPPSFLSPSSHPRTHETHYCFTASARHRSSTSDSCYWAFTLLVNFCPLHNKYPSK